MSDKSLCAGCRNDYYNGHNERGITECWSFPTATVVRRKLVHINQVPPWTQPAQRMLSCYHRAQFIVVDEERQQ